MEPRDFGMLGKHSITQLYLQSYKSWFLKKINIKKPMGKRGERVAVVPGASASSRTSYTTRVITSGPTHRSSNGSPLHWK